MKLSIIVPVYNVEKYLSRCIESLLAQDDDDYEIIAVNDGSTDSSLKILESFSSPKLKVYSKPNGGLSSARNYGLKRAVGEYIFFVDSDDFISTNCIHRVNATLKGCDLLVFGHIYKNDSYELSVSHVPTSGREFSMKGCPTAVWNYVFKKQFLTKNNLYFKEGIFHEDTLFTPMVVYLANSIVLFEDGVYHYNLDNPSSTTHTNSAKRCKDLMLVVDDLATFADKVVKANDKLMWGGNNLSAAINNLMLLAYSCDFSIREKTKYFFRERRFLADYLVHSPKLGTRVVGIISKKIDINIFRIYCFFYRIRYGFNK